MGELLKVFITYSHEDTDSKDKLRQCLNVMEQQGMIRIWHDNEILPGDKWDEDISKNLADSDILLYLVSASSLASKNCNKELGEALSEKIKVIPIILEDCDWQNHQLSDVQALPDKGKPINEWQPESKGWQSVVAGLRKVIGKMLTKASDSNLKEILPEWVFQQGNFLMMLGQSDKAIEAYSHAIELNPNNAIAYYNRGTAHHSKGELDRAIADYNKAIELNPEFAEAYNNRGNTCSDKGELDRAIADYNKAIELNPRLELAYYNRGAVHYNKGELDRAIADYNKAIELKPDYAKAYNNRGNAYHDTGKLDRAIADYNKAIELKPNYTDAYYNRGDTYRDKGELDCAITDYDKAIELNPELAEAYNNRGNAYRRNGKVDLAIEDYNRTIELRPDDALAYNNRGIAYLIKDELDHAVGDYSKAIELRPDDALAYYNRGITYVNKGAVDRAIEDYSKALDLKPELALAYYNRGEAWLRLRKWNKAKTDLIAAKNMDVDIIATFRNDYKTVAAFERRHGFQLPEDIAIMLTQRRRSRFPKTQKGLGQDIQQDVSHHQDHYSLRENSFRKTEKVLSVEGQPSKSPDVVNLLEKLRNAGTPLGQYVETPSHFGIKTSMDDALVVDRETRDKLIAEHPSSADILKPFLRGRDIRRWQVDAPDLWLIFTHGEIDIDTYPAILKHLKKYRDSLSKRTGKQEWYELQATSGDSEYFTQPKLVCPNRYNHQTFAVDKDGLYCEDTCYLIQTEETWLCGVLNSSVVKWFYSEMSDQLTAAELRTLSGYMQKIPIPNVTSTQKELISKIVNYLIYLQKQPTTNSKDLAHARDYMMLKYFERIIDGLVYECYLPEALHQGSKYFFKPLLDEHLPQPDEISGDKMSVFRDIFEHLYERTHSVRKNLFFLDSVKPVRIIEGKW